MRIALLHPTYWPEVRRGSERLIHDLAVTLSGRGHDVTLLTTHRASRAVTTEDGFVVDRARRLPQRGPLRWHEHHITAAPPAFVRLLSGNYDIAHAFFPVEAWAARHARRYGGPPVVASFHGIVNREYLVKRRYRLEMFEGLARDADEVSVLSAAAAAPFERYFGRRPEVLPGGVITAGFAVDVERTADPTILCPASVGDPRKRGPLLLEGFAALRDRVPAARLRLVRTPDPLLSGDVGPLPDGAEWVDGDDTDVLARLYAESWVTVLPAVDEAFGLVLVESLAAGTPVVASRSGAAPEIVTDAAAGRLFEPDDARSLTAELGAALDLAGEAGTREAARALAAPWDWDAVADRYERVYAVAAG